LTIKSEIGDEVQNKKPGIGGKHGIPEFGDQAPRGVYGKQGVRHLPRDGFPTLNAVIYYRTKISISDLPTKSGFFLHFSMHFMIYVS